MGWRCDPLGLPQRIDGSVIGAFIFYVEEDSLSRFNPGWRYPRQAYHAARPQQLLQAA